MALEAVVFSPQAGHFGYGLPWCDLAGLGGFAGDSLWDHHHHDGLLQVSSVSPPDADEWDESAAIAAAWQQDHQQSSEASTEEGSNSNRDGTGPEPAAAVAATGRRKRRRAKVVKNSEEMETQRMTHIAVERNRRRQMNEYLAALRSLMPPSYAHRGDQASIVGGAINYVRELEQLLQSLEVRKSIRNRRAEGRSSRTAAAESPFAGFFTFPQYSTTSTSSHVGSGAASSGNNNTSNNLDIVNGGDAAAGRSAERCRHDDQQSEGAAVADIEVTMVEGHASLKVLAPRRPKQLLKLVAGLHHLRVPPLHLNVTSVDAMVLYTFSLKVEDDSKMGSVEEIATAVHEILSSVQRQEETAVM